MPKKAPESTTPKSARTPPTRKAPNGGTLRSGNPGNAGNTRALKLPKKNGRPANDELAWVKKLATSPRMKRRLRDIVRKGQYRDILTLWKMATDRAYGAPNQKHEVKTSLATLLGEEDPTAV